VAASSFDKGSERGHGAAGNRIRSGEQSITLSNWQSIIHDVLFSHIFVFDSFNYRSNAINAETGDRDYEKYSLHTDNIFSTLAEVCCTSNGERTRNRDR